jgi:aryl-alcohol dehydrogenase-like predicted oxidoreductase
MEMTTLGRTGLNVSRICFGGWQAFGWSSSNDDRYMATLEEALASGINFIDTAEGYGDGHSEKLIGRVLKGRRSDFILASKFSHNHSREADLRNALERTLKNLDTDYIDVYQQHWPPKSPPLEETIGVLEKLKKEGKIRAIGVSNWMDPEWAEISDPSRIETLQPCYSLLWRTIEKGVLDICARHNIGIMAYSPLCQGVLSGRFNGNDIPKDSRKQNVFLKPDRFPAVQAFLVEARSIADNYGKSLSQLALRWLLDRKEISAVIIGASSTEQLAENLGALDWRLSPEDHRKLAELSQPLSADFGPHDSLWRWHPRR